MRQDLILDYLKKLRGYADGGQVGMGDVQMADRNERLQPVLQQGYGSPEDDKLAQDIQNSNAPIAKAGIPVSNVSPEEVAKFNALTQMALGTMGGIKTVGNKAGTVINSLTDVIDNPNIIKPLEHMPEHFAPEGQWKESGYNYRLNTSEDPLVAIKDNKVIGHLGVNGEGKVQSVSIDPEHQREGIATQLYKKAKELYGTLRSDDLNAMEPEAKSLWEKLRKENPEITKTKNGYIWPEKD